MKKNTSNMAADYDSAPAGAAQAPSGDPGSMADQYDQADSSQADSSSDADNDADLDISAADVTKMQSLKDSGDMAGLGTYVAQFLK